MELPRSTFELLFRASRLVNEAALARINARQRGPAMRPAHTQLFPHISRAGIRATVLADRLGVTKQAIGPLIDDLETAGMVERIEDPADARAKLVRWTKRGERALHDGLGELAALEHELANVVGASRFADLADTCEKLIAALATTEPRTSRTQSHG
jgi:DNA-binding MarR family transcriptional regulator